PGPSPRARGRHASEPNWLAAGGTIPACAGRPHQLARAHPLTRTIPACAGPTHGVSAAISRSRDHPRVRGADKDMLWIVAGTFGPSPRARGRHQTGQIDRKSTRLNSSHVKISYAVFCLK